MRYGNCVVADDVSQYSMVKFYENGADFLHENIDILRERPLETTFFQRVRSNISAYRCVKRDGKAVSVAAVHEESNGLTRISEVYTLPEYRNKGFARQTVTSFTADILKCGRTPYLHVDKTNPVSNRLYLSIGYVYGKSKLEIERVIAS